MKRSLSLVTALYDLGRGDVNQHLADYQRRPFADYLSAFDSVLRIDAPLSIYIPLELESYVWQRRNRDNTRVLAVPLEAWQKRFPFFEQVQQIRQDPAWRGRAEWLAESPQANLAYYNPIVMSKMGMLNDQQLTNPFGCEHFLWIDAGLARTCGGYLDHPDWVSRTEVALERFLFICFPYIGGGEVHGYDRAALARLAGTDYIRRVARGGLFGGSREAIGKANALYWRLLELSFAQGEMGTEESIFSAMTYLEPELFDRFEIEDNGLIGPFFESLQRGRAPLVRTRIHRGLGDREVRRGTSTAMYILTFNQPQQLALLIRSWRQQPAFFERSAVYVIDNSTEEKALAENRALCAEHGFTHLPQGNIGICGGRQLAAELFAASDRDYMFFLEDDMLLAAPEASVCGSGFVRWVESLYDKVLGIMERERFDFLKLSFSELYGVNSDQWAWYNVPASVRQSIWPAQSELPQLGLAPSIPKVQFEEIGNFAGLAYASGEVYYSNWPQVVSREGNRRMFLETKWAHPYEQTWMSHHFQETRAGRLRPAVLLASVIQHQRDFYYGAHERVES
jgi:hypothetical protein